jgi:hypothetical protein
MTFAMLYAEDGSIVATYESQDVALRALLAFVRANPRMQDEIGLRPYEAGRPAGAFKSASELLGSSLAQPQLLG